MPVFLLRSVNRLCDALPCLLHPSVVPPGDHAPWGIRLQSGRFCSFLLLAPDTSRKEAERPTQGLESPQCVHCHGLGAERSRKAWGMHIAHNLSTPTTHSPTASGLCVPAVHGLPIGYAQLTGWQRTGEDTTHNHAVSTTTAIKCSSPQRWEPWIHLLKNPGQEKNTPRSDTQPSLKTLVGFPSLWGRA